MGPLKMKNLSLNEKFKIGQLECATYILHYMKQI